MIQEPNLKHSQHRIPQHLRRYPPSAGALIVCRLVKRKWLMKASISRKYPKF